MTWLTAFVLTQAIEIPVYLAAGRRLVPRCRWLFAAGASTVTHPIIWFAIPWQTAPWLACLMLAESIAVAGEALLGRWAGLERPWVWSLVANVSSMAVGLVLHAFDFIF